MQPLTTAMGMFLEMGMQFWFEKTEAELQALEIAVLRTREDSRSRA